jgi:hypothetical protein
MHGCVVVVVVVVVGRCDERLERSTINININIHIYIIDAFKYKITCCFRSFSMAIWLRSNLSSSA